MSLEDLRVVDSYHDTGHAYTRPATREDVLTAVSDLGGERVDWCEVHSVSAKRPDLCWGASDSYARGHVPARCRITPQLRVLLDTGDTEWQPGVSDKEQP